jgi:hypothetical protein
MIVELKFTLPDEQYEFESAIHGKEYRMSIINVLNNIRTKLKNKHSEELLEVFNDIIDCTEGLPLED